MSRDEKQMIGPGDEKHIENLAFQNGAIQPISYEIRIQGQMSNQWFDCFDGLAFQVLENDQTLIRAILTDKSALHGLLTRIGELNLNILSIKKIEETFGPNETR